MTDVTKKIPIEARRERLFYALRRIRPKLRGSERDVALAIGWHLNRNSMTAWPGMRYLASKLDLAVSTVCKAILTLEERGLLYVARSRVGRRNSANRYSFPEALFAELPNLRSSNDELAKEIYDMAGANYGERGRSLMGQILHEKPLAAAELHSELMEAIENGIDIDELAHILWSLTK